MCPTTYPPGPLSRRSRRKLEVYLTFRNRVKFAIDRHVKIRLSQTPIGRKLMRIFMVPNTVDTYSDTHLGSRGGRPRVERVDGNEHYGHSREGGKPPVQCSRSALS